ncbi:MAG: type I-E CRISPR-associated protein Cas6/Cse3/CasE [Hyphomicrobium sp.]|nr:type I-E CRISPR-associated protein Cas6/Cse3/CasE [Hyphomicrobium sp.]
MIMSKAELSRAPGTQGSLAKVLLTGTQGDRSHGLVWSLFSRSDEIKRDFLFREIEPGSYIIVSHRPPEDPHGLWNVTSQQFEPALQVGHRLGFVLRANPAMSVAQPGKKRGLRVDAIMHAKSKVSKMERAAFSAQDAQTAGLGWLIKRGPAIGVDFDAEYCSATGYRQVQVQRQRPAKPIEFSEIDYEGVLTVTDPIKLMAALANGIGKAKSYGCGLMLVRRT